ncbi:MAG: TusE/DsrC/DsvC family sulfur relay protein [Pseudomonadota bacterium]|nr:TusE/DsrC/DsvC family sulfur relay protein [Pseudomonadota bacterium]
MDIDDSGFLEDPDNWDEKFASQTAELFDLYLTKEHWEVIKFIRNYYTKHNKVPELRELLKSFEVNFGKEKSSRKYIYNLFPYGYGQQACRIAGMRQPKKLWLDL